MKLVSSTVEFIVESKLFIAFCALAYVSKTSLLLYGSFGNIHVNLFVFFAILLIYCFHGLNKRKLLFVMALVAFAGACTQFFYLPLQTLYIIIPAGLIGLGYTFHIIPSKHGWIRLRDIYWFKILWISFSFSWLTTFLPVVFSGSLHDITHAPSLFIFARSFLFIFSICIPFDIRDMKFDRAKGVKTLPLAAGTNNAILIAIAFLILFIGLAIIQYCFFHLDFRLACALSLSALITMFTIPFSKRKIPAFRYSLLYDGSMFLQWALIVISLHF